MAAFDQIKLCCLINLTLHSVKVSSSPNSSLLFAIVFWCEKNRSSHSQMFFKIDIFKNLKNFTGKHQCWSLFLIKLQAWRRLFAKFLINTFFLQITSGGCFRANPGGLCVSLCGKKILVIKHKFTLVVQYHVTFVN